MRPTLLVCLTVSAVGLSACASNSGPRESFSFVQVYQDGDPNLTCDELQTEINELDGKISRLDAAIQSQRNMSQTFSALGAMGGANAGFGAQASANEANRLQGYRPSYQQRRDVLMQQYYALECSAPPSEAAAE